MFAATPSSPPMFKNKFLDAFSRVPWFLVPIVYVPIIVGLLGYGLVTLGIPVWATVLLYAAGWFVWTFTEYWLHRTLFHWTPATSWGPRFHFFLHGVHHEYIDDHLRLVMPPAASMGLAVVFFAMWYAILGIWAVPFFAGKVTGYLGYDMVHYYVHHGKPTSKWMKRLRANHMNHHHNKDGRKFGVSTMFWDRVFQTA